MTSKSDKERRKQLLMELKNKELEIFIKSLPMNKEKFIGLFDYLDSNLGEGCDHHMTLTKNYLKEKGIENIDGVISWLNDKGGYCDCEVLFNVEEQFELLE